jgi:hypothetical protein
MVTNEHNSERGKKTILRCPHLLRQLPHRTFAHQAIALIWFTIKRSIALGKLDVGPITLKIGI